MPHPTGSAGNRPASPPPDPPPHTDGGSRGAEPPDQPRDRRPRRPYQQRWLVDAPAHRPDPPPLPAATPRPRPGRPGTRRRTPADAQLPLRPSPPPSPPPLSPQLPEFRWVGDNGRRGPRSARASAVPGVSCAPPSPSPSPCGSRQAGRGRVGWRGTHARRGEAETADSQGGAVLLRLAGGSRRRLQRVAPPWAAVRPFTFPTVLSGL